MPKRMIRDWTKSELVDQLSPGAEVFFTRLIMQADDFGNYTANIKLVNAALFPLKGYSSHQVIIWLDECAKVGLIQLYEVDKKALIHIKDFDQKLRRMHAVYPPPPVGQVTDNGRTSADKRPPELEVEDEVEDERKMKDICLTNFEQLFDDIWKEQVQMNPSYKGKDLTGAIQKAYAFLQAENRLARGQTSDFKKTVLAFMNNDRPSKSPLTKNFKL